MREKALAASWLLVLACCCPCGHRPVPEAAYGSFEYEEAELAAAGWIMEVKPPAEVALDNIDCYTGNNSLRIRHTETATTILHRPVQLAPETEYTLAFAAKTSGVETATGQTGLYVRLVDTAAGKTLVEKRIGSRDSQWVSVLEAFKTAKPNEYRLQVALQEAKGTVWLDDLKIVPGRAKETVRFGTPETGENVALGKPCRMKPAPNYRLCRDKDDAAQLTDGKFTTGYFWTQASTVGWQSRDVVITVDLGGVCPIDTVAIDMAGGGQAGVFFPSAILILVSDDGKAYYHVSTISEPSLKEFQNEVGHWYVHKFRATNLKTRGRYVQFGVQARGAYIFTDEVEVMKGAHDPASVDFSSVKPVESAEAVFGGMRRMAPVQSEIARLSQFIHKNRREIGRGVADLLKADTESLAARIYADGYSQESAAAKLHEARRLRAKAWAAVTGKKGLVCWPADPVVNLQEDEAPRSVRVEPALAFAWIGEYEPLAVNVSNTGETQAVVKVALTGESTALISQTELREAVPSDSAQGTRPLDALPKPLHGQMRIPPGVTRQVFLICKTHGLRSGCHSLRLEVRDASSGTLVSFPLALELSALRFPDRTALNTYSWAYVNCWGACKNNQEKAIADLKAHYQRNFILHPACQPQLKLSADKKRVESIDFSFHDEMLHKHEPFDQISCFWGFSGKTPGGDRFGGGWMSDTWKANFAHWLKAWVAHMKDLGYGYDRFFMYPCDETVAPGFRKLTALMKEIDPQLRIWADPTGNSKPDELRAIAPYIDVWCPHLNGFARRSEDREFLFSLGKPVWTYLCSGPGKNLDPLDYYRFIFWRAYHYGYRGCGFWAYGDTGWSPNSAWTDSDGRRHDYAIVYDAATAPEGVNREEEIIPSRRWEAWRQGVEDYEYLWQLAKHIEAAKAKQPDHATVKAAEHFLNGLAERTVNSVNGTAGLNGVRRNITDHILKLKRLAAD